MHRGAAGVAGWGSKRDRGRADAAGGVRHGAANVQRNESTPSHDRRARRQRETQRRIQCTRGQAGATAWARATWWIHWIRGRRCAGIPIAVPWVWRGLRQASSGRLPWIVHVAYALVSPEGAECSRAPEDPTPAFETPRQSGRRASASCEWPARGRRSGRRDEDPKRRAPAGVGRNLAHFGPQLRRPNRGGATTPMHGTVVRSGRAVIVGGATSGRGDTHSACARPRGVGDSGFARRSLHRQRWHSHVGPACGGGDKQSLQISARSKYYGDKVG